MTGTLGKLFAVVPAAGRGTRLGSDLPKLVTLHRRGRYDMDFAQSQTSKSR
jgi:bifunctional N-acetylglucosamine-1-phosphate-uridyltransferase/glucosamine-1-phosphate-acetyltransferase GlmU-like protein